VKFLKDKIVAVDENLHKVHGQLAVQNDGEGRIT
jgi:hypothetical protein